MISILVSDELTRRGDRLLERRRKQAGFRDPHKTLDNFDFGFNKKMNRSLVFDLATATFITRREDALFLGPPGTGKSHLAQAIGQAVIQQGYRVLYRETHTLLDEFAEATLDGNRKEYMEWLVSLPLLILDDLGMRKLPLTAAEDLLEISIRLFSKNLSSGKLLSQPATLSGHSISSILLAMQAESFDKLSLFEKQPYNPGAMGRRVTKTRPKQGVRLAELRKASGLSQYELARMVGAPQANIAFWERSEKPPRSEVLPKMADALGVRIEDLLNGSAVTQKVRARKSKPVGKVRQAFEEVSKLPRRQQDKIVEFVTAFVQHYQQNRQD